MEIDLTTIEPTVGAVLETLANTPARYLWTALGATTIYTLWVVVRNQRLLRRNRRLNRLVAAIPPGVEDLFRPNKNDS